MHSLFYPRHKSSFFKKHAKGLTHQVAHQKMKVLIEGGLTFNDYLRLLGRNIEKKNHTPSRDRFRVRVY